MRATEGERKAREDPVVCWPRGIAFLALAGCCTALNASPASGGGVQSATFAQEVTLSDHVIPPIGFRYEVVSDPDTALFARPVGAFLHRDGRQFYFDEGDQDFKVLSADNEFLFSFGGRGQGPGEWLHVGAAAFGPNDDLYVWDEMQQVLHVFDDSGRFRRRVYQKDRLKSVFSMVWTGPDELTIAGLSFVPGYFGFLAHRLAPQQEHDAVWRLEHRGSFVEIPRFESALYMILSKGSITRATDGGVIAKLALTHRIEHYSRNGERTWAIADPALMPDAESRLAVGENGRMRIQPYPRSLSLVVTEDWIVHQMLLEPEGLPAQTGPGIVDTSALDWNSITIRRRFEFIRTKAPDAPRTVIETTVPLSIRSSDSQGRFYGLIGNDDPIPVRGTFTNLDPLPRRSQ